MTIPSSGQRKPDTQEIRREHTALDLSPEESAWLAEALRRPAREPNPLLLSALAAYGEVIESEETSG